MKQVLRASAIVLGLVACSLPARADDHQETIVLPCSTTAVFHTSEWDSTAIGTTGLSFRLPPGFVPVAARFIEGGKRWQDHFRTIEYIHGIWDDSSFGYKGPDFCPIFRECTDSIAGAPYHIITRSLLSPKDSSITYSAVAYPAGKRHGYTIALVGRSPSADDLGLFLAVFRTLKSAPR